MTLVIEILLTGASLLALIPVMVLFVEVLFSVTGGPPVPALPGDRRRIAVVMPAHDEESVIADTLRTLVPQLAAADRLIVVADNCTDSTAAVAASQGAEVIVRTDAARRGKGFALDFGVRHLETDPPDVVIIIDADCRVDAGAIDRLARLCTQAQRPIQSLYLMRAAPGSGLKMRIAEFAWAVKNQVRPLGLYRMGLPCQLMGTGMAFPWRCIGTAVLATGHIVEDLKLGIELARAGAPPLFCPDVLVSSDFPASSEGVTAQRTRWEHGHLMVILAEAPRLLMRGLASLNGDLIAMALDLTVPPLALLLIQSSIVWILSGLLYLVTGARLPLLVASVAVALLPASVLLSWARYGRNIISLTSLLLAPVYAAWKIPLYAKFVVARQLDWVKSKRGKDA